MLAFGRSGSSSARVEPREVSTKLKEIRVSPWTLNLVTKLARGLPVVEAAAQLKFCKKKHTITVLRAMQVLCTESLLCIMSIIVHRLLGVISSADSDTLKKTKNKFC